MLYYIFTIFILFTYLVPLLNYLFTIIKIQIVLYTHENYIPTLLYTKKYTTLYIPSTPEIQTNLFTKHSLHKKPSYLVYNIYYAACLLYKTKNDSYPHLI